MKCVVIISNLRMLLIFLLLNPYKLKDVFFIFDETIDINFNRIYQYYFVRKARSPFDLFFLNIKYFCIFSYFNLKFKLKLLPVYGADHISGSKFFLKRNNFFLIEDGTANYSTKSYKRSLKNILFSIPVFGVHSNVKRILLTKREAIPDIIRHKVELINIKSLWNEKSKNEQEKILNILQSEYLDLNPPKGEKITLLLTQPLSEDGIISEEEKVAIYKKLLLNHKNFVMIKPHPREKTDYKLHMDNVCVINKNYPSELLDLLNISFDEIVTLFSTAAQQYPKEKVVYYGTNVNPKLKKIFGDIHF